MDHVPQTPGFLQTTIIPLGLLAGLTLLVQMNFLLAHSLVELFTILVAYGLFVIAWNTRQLQSNHFFLFLGMAYLCVGSFDLLHALAYKGMGVFSNQDANLSIQLWIIARYIEAGSLLLAPVFFKRRLAVGIAFTGCLVLFTGGLLSLFAWPVFPVCFSESTGLTQFKVISEYVICLLLLGAGGHLFRQRAHVDPFILKLLLASLIATILAEVSFTFYVSVYGLSNIIGHYGKLISFYLIYRALLETGLTRPVRLLFRDLSESRQAWRDSAEAYRALYDAAPVAFFNVDTSGTIRLANQEAGRMLNRNPDDMIGLQIFDLYVDGPTGKEKSRQIFDAFLSGKETPYERLQMTRLGDNPIWVGLTIRIERDDQGQTLQGFGVACDITARVEAEQQLRLANARYRELFNNMRLGCAVYQRSTEGRYTIVDFNRAAETIDRRKKEDILLNDVEKVFPGIEEFGLLQVFERVWHTGEARHYPDSFYHDSQSEGWHDSYVYKLPTGEIVSLFEDVSARKQAEQVLAQTLQQLREANTDLSNFSHAVAHDLKAPLRAISNYATFLEEDLPAETAATSLKMLSEIKTIAAEAYQLAENMLVLAEIGGRSLLRERVDPIDVLRHIKETHTKEGSEIISIAQGLPEFDGDTGLFRQIMQNLVENGLRYNRSDPKEIRIEGRSIGEAFVEFSVSDNGIGIAREHHERIFEPFQCLHTPLEQNGTGAGLAIVKRCVEKLGGTIRVVSAPDQGSTFIVALPQTWRISQPQ